MARRDACGGALAALVAVALGLPAGLAEAAPLAPYQTVLVARQTAADGGAPADEGAGEGRVSRDGRFVAFTSRSNNLVAETRRLPREYDPWPFLRGVAGDTMRILTPRSTSSVDRPVFAEVADMTPDRRFVLLDSDDAFQRQHGPPEPGREGVVAGEAYVRDLQTGSMHLVSRRDGANGAPAGGGHSAAAYGAGISNDGSRVLFRTAASNLAMGDRRTGDRLFVRDRKVGRTTLVTARRKPDESGRYFSGGDLSADGRYVTYIDLRDNETDPGGHHDDLRIVLRDVETGRSLTVARWNSGDNDGGDELYYAAPVVSRGGRFVVYAKGWTSFRHHPFELLRWDRETGKRVVVSQGSGVLSGARAVISDTGRFVAFVGHSGRRNAFDYVQDVWERDVKEGRTYIVSRASGRKGALANAPSYDPAISAGGGYVTFTTTATNLTARPGALPRLILRRVLP